MSSAKKWSQQQLRSLMKEKVQSKKNTRIDSPLAKYDDQDNLWCLVCNQIISTDFLWSTHLIGKSHKKRVEELKLKKQTTAKNPEVSINPLKRTLNHQESIPSKISRTDIDFPRESSKLKTNKSAKKNDQRPSFQNDNNIDSTLPQDFFDDKIAPAEEPINHPTADMIKTKTPAEKEDQTSSSTTLPKGFFDDPQMDAKVRKTTHLESIDAQFELFRKEIAEESLVSENIVEEDVVGLEREKTLIEIDEQIENWSKVDQIQKKIEELHRKKDHHHKDDPMDSNDSDSDDQLDLNNMNFWRKKDVFL